MSRRVAAAATVAGLLVLMLGGAFWLAVALLVGLALVGLVEWARRAYNDPERAAHRAFLRANPDWPSSTPTARRYW